MNAQSSEPEFWIYFHPLLPDYLNEAKEFGLQAKTKGYTTIAFRLCGNEETQTGNTYTAVRKLIGYFKSDLGLKVIPEFKLLGKSHKAFKASIIKEHPELFVGDIIDPYAQYKGKPAFESLIIPRLDEHLEVFGNPEYFILGWDEYNTDNIKKIADRNGKSVSEVWAGTLNRTVDYLLSKNVTPIIFGDMLLSSRLAEPVNPLGYPADARFKNFSEMHSVYPPQSKTDLLPFVKDIKNRDKIIVGDWHYRDEKEYPSVDYFKWLGFKEVIPVTWRTPENMKYASMYARDNGCRRMMASSWHCFAEPSVRHRESMSVDNSIMYFKNPALEIPDSLKISVFKNGIPAVTAQPGDTITLSMARPGKNVQFDVYADEILKMALENAITLNGSGDVNWKIPANIKQGLYTIHGYSKREDGYLLNGTLVTGLYIGNNPETVKPRTTAFVDADFSSCTILDNRYVLLNGGSDCNFGIITGQAKVVGNALCCKNGGLLTGGSGVDRQLMGKDKTVMISFSVDTLPNGQDVAGLLSWGFFGSGFRLFIMNRKLHVQIFGAGGTAPVNLISKDTLNTGEKYLAVFNMNKSGSALYLNGTRQAFGKAVESNIIAVSPLCIGCWHREDATKVNNCLDGKIYRFAMWHQYVDAKTAGQ